MTFTVRTVRNPLTGGIAAAAISIIAAGCGSHSAGTGPAASTASVPSVSVSPASTSASVPHVQAASPASATSASVSPASASVSPASAPICLTSDLRITLGDGGAGAGTDYRVLDFTNSGTVKCTLYGFPGVSLINSANAQIGAAAIHNPMNASTVVTLAPGAEASALLGIGTAENYPAGVCKPAPAARLKVFPPDQTQAIDVPVAATGCAASAAHLLTVTAIIPGPAGRSTVSSRGGGVPVP